MTRETTDLEKRLRALGLYGLLAHLEDVALEPWVEQLILWEERERARRGLERRLERARLGSFKPISDFDWSWPKEIDRVHIEDLFRLDWLTAATNVVLVGPNGVGKTMIAKNLVYQAVLAGATARFITASELLATLAEQQTSAALNRKMANYCRPRLLAVDEIGYLSYDSHYADLLYELVSRRYEHRPIVLTTNKPFVEWAQVFPNASCVVTIVDRITHHCEIVTIAAESYRLKESKEAARRRAKERARRAKAKPSANQTTAANQRASTPL